jgi:hypothetical protein
MHNKTWKQERDLLSEAYASIAETTHSPENSCKDDEYYCSKDKVCKKKDVKEESDDVVASVTGDVPVTGDTVEPVGDEPLGDPVEPIDGAIPDTPREPDEVDAEIDSLKSLILNPPADKIEQYAKQGQLHVYVDMLKKKLEAAEAVKAAVRGETD